MRVYVPATLSGLAQFAKQGELGPVPLTGYAVTPELREWHEGDDEEELEYAALTAAARASLRLLAVPGAEPRYRRVVIAAEIPDAAVLPDGELPGLARIEHAIVSGEVAAFHLDDPAAEPAVEEAALVSDAADAGDAAAQLTVEGLDDHDLLWFASQELYALLE
jgi:hypothetical protein